MVERSKIRLAVDIGGTFTDVVLDGPFGRLTRKVLTTASRPEEGLMAGASQVLDDAGIGFSGIDIFVHGTTLATNAILERRGARTALVTTDGFRDAIEIGSEGRYDQYDLQLVKPAPLVPRSLRFCVPERLDAKGQVRKPLDRTALGALLPVLREQEIESVAISFLHSYVNSVHEEQAAAVLAAELPHLSITLSSEVCPEIREYERASTAIANAYVRPIIDSYLVRMSDALAARSFRGALFLMTSGGGLTSIEIARRFPIRLVESGPAGGAMFAARRARELGEDKTVAFDMGGTTAKICLIRDGEPTKTVSFEVDRSQRFLKGSGLPLRIPAVELVEIGAGGGSIASVDALGRVTVGPESAGSEPGPACYPHGGDRPTVTDGDLTLGLIDPASFAGGRVKLSADRAAHALDTAVGASLNLTVPMAAYAVYETVCESMASAVRVHAAERGEPIADFTMIAFGGAAPLHAAAVAEKVGVRRVVIPQNAGVGSAVGFLEAPVAFELVRSRYMRLDQFDAEGARTLLADMRSAAKAVVAPASSDGPLIERRKAFMRYVGQGHELGVELPDDHASLDPKMLRTTFEELYATQFGRFIPGAAMEILNWSVLISVPYTDPGNAPGKVVPLVVSTPQSEARLFYDGQAGGWREIPLYRRQALPPGAAMAGPAIIVEDETTTFVSGRFDAQVDAAGCIVLTRKAA